MWFFGKKRKAQKALEEKQKQEALKKAEDEKREAVLSKEKAAENAKPKAEPAKPKVEPKPVVKQEEVEGEDDGRDDDKTPNKPAKYHVSQNKDQKSEFFKKWRVRKEGSQKTIKFFDTQLEAIKYAESLAESAGTSVVIHKVDGSIRKQDYTKKV